MPVSTMLLRVLRGRRRPDGRRSGACPAEAPRGSERHGQGVRRIWQRSRRGLFGGMTTLALLVATLTPAVSAAQPIVPTCAVSTVYVPLVSLSNVTSLRQICGIETLENDAYDQYAAYLGMTPGDPRILEPVSARADIVGIMEGMLRSIAYLNAHASSSGVPLSYAEQGAYNWLASMISSEQITAAQDAVNEYSKWQKDPCTYVPPDPAVFTFRGALDPACSGSEAPLLAGPTPPTEANFIAYGQYEALSAAGLNTPPTKYQGLASESVLESQASWISLLLSAVPKVLQQVTPEGLSSLYSELAPNNYVRGPALDTFKGVIRVEMIRRKRLNDLAQEEELQAEGEAENPLLKPSASLSSQDIADDLGIDVTDFFDVGESAAAGAASMTGPFIVISLSAVALAQEATLIARAQKLPGQLQSNLSTIQANAGSPSYLWNLFHSASGTTLADEFVQSQISFPAPSVGVPATAPSTASPGGTVNGAAVIPTSTSATTSTSTSKIYTTPPSGGTQFQVSMVNSAGTTVYTEYVPTVKIAAWPLGINQGEYGAPQETIAVADGLIWHTPNPDQAAAGLSGYLPSNAIHFYNWAGAPPTGVHPGQSLHCDALARQHRHGWV